MSENEVKIEVDKDGFIIRKGDFSANYYAEDFQTKLLHKAFLQLTNQLQTAKEENEKLHKEILNLRVKNSDLIHQVATKDVTIKINGKTKIAVASRVKEILDIIDGKDNLTQ